MRKYKADGKTMETAVHLAIRDLSDDSPIKKYLLSMEAEVVFSCIFEYDEQKVMNQFREEGREEGRSEERIETAKRMIRNGKLSLTEIAECSGLTTEEVQKLAVCGEAEDQYIRAVLVVKPEPVKFHGLVKNDFSRRKVINSPVAACVYIAAYHIYAFPEIVCFTVKIPVFR